MKKNILLQLTALCVFCGSAFGQFTNVMISNTNDPEEISICINPKNPSQVVAGANINNLYRSSDGGLTWNVGTLNEPVLGVWGDPIIFTDTAGAFYYSHLSYPPSGSWIDRIVFQKSTDGGVTWSAGTYTGLNGSKAQDKEAVIVNQQTNEIYVTWTQFDVYGSADPADSSLILFSKSSDAGATWSNPVRLSMDAGNCIDSDSTVEGAIPMIGPAGEIYVVWMNINGLVFNKSLDNGLTWLPHETLITSVPGGWDYNIAGLQRCNGLPQAICDLTGGPNHGTIYINWTDQRNGTTDTDVWLIKSTDGGTTWSSPVRVNDDAPGRQQFLTWMDIDETNGNLYFVFYDRRNSPPASQKTDVYLARSTDGGNTFSNYKINQNFFIPSPTVFFGDYTGISAYNNAIRPAWMQYDSGTLSVWTAIIEDAALNIEEASINAYSPVLEQNSPNPFSENTWIRFTLKKPGLVNLFVYDVFGNKVAVLYENEKFRQGDYDYIFNASAYRLPPGIYYYSLSSDEYTLTKKMIVY
ncbi:MAG TPA: T9SS type A sorting domain-containing protein [Bacteroidia bacterium]